MCGFCLFVGGVVVFLFLFVCVCVCGGGGGGYIYIYYTEAVFFVNVQCGRQINKEVYFTMACLLYLRLFVFCQS